MEEEVVEKTKEAEQPEQQSKLVWLIIIIFIAVVVWFGRGSLGGTAAPGLTTGADGRQQFELRGMTADDIKQAYDDCAGDPSCNEQDFIYSLETQLGN